MRYQTALLLRAHRWAGPVVLYALLLGFVGDEQPLRQGLGWSAAMLIPVVAWLTRSALTLEPDAARSVVAVAGGPHRAHLATLIAPLTGGAVLALAGAAYEIARDQRPDHPAALIRVIVTGLGIALVCLLVGSAAGTLCNPPLVRHPALGIFATMAVVVLALVSDVSPASAALRGSGGTQQSASWLTGLPLLVALALTGVSWLVSTLVAARRG